MQNAVAVIDEPRHHLALDTPIGRVYWVEVAPGDATLLHRHNFDYVTVVIGDAVVGNRHFGEEEVVSRLQDGHTFYSHAPFEHVVRNAGTEPFLNFTISMLRNGAGPDNNLFKTLGSISNTGTITFERLFDERCARAAKVRLTSGQSLELDGDTIVVARRNCDLTVTGIDIQRVQRAATLCWCSGQTHLTTTAECDLVVIGIR